MLHRPDATAVIRSNYGSPAAASGHCVPPNANITRQFR
jgi:hypothetical protein